MTVTTTATTTVKTFGPDVTLTHYRQAAAAPPDAPAGTLATVVSPSGTEHFANVVYAYGYASRERRKAASGD